MTYYEFSPVVLVDNSGNPYGNASSAFSTNTAATTNATSVKASAGYLQEVTVSNTSGAIVYFKVYNKASAPTVGTDIPLLTIPVAASSTVSSGFGSAGKRFTTGLAWAITGAIAATDTSAVAAGIQVSGTYL